MRSDVERWYRRRTWHRPGPAAADLAARLAGRTVAVVLPAKNEERTIGPVVAALRRELVDRVPLVSELLVVDSHSTDATAAIAARAGATVLASDDVLPGLPPLGGKGEAMWKGLAATRGDVVVYLDSDVTGFDPGWVPALLEPLVADEAVQLVKGCYDRPLIHPGGTVEEGGGGRVTELLVRPLLAALWPELSGLVQPLAGECAARRSHLEQLPFVTGYGVEIGLVLDTARLRGVDALAQVDLGRRVHRNRPTAALGPMADAVLRTALQRLALADGPDLLAAAVPQVHFARDAGGHFAAVPAGAGSAPERPPLSSLVR